MNAARMGLNVVGHNLANSTAPGFSRQRILQHNFAYVNFQGASRANLNSGRGGTDPMQRGLGTNVTSTTQIRDLFIDISYRRELGRLGFHAPIADTGFEIEMLLSELHGALPTQTVFNDIWDALNELSVNQSGLEVRNNFIATAVTFLNKMNSVHSHLRAYQQNLNNQVKSTVIRVNQLLEQVAQLNVSIAANEGHSLRDDRWFFGDNANDLRDRRNNALDELSSLLHITFWEDARGMVSIRSGGSELLSGGIDVNRIGLKQSAPGTNLVLPVITNSRDVLPYDAPSGTYQLLFDVNDEIAAHRGNDSGRLLGLIIARGLSEEDSYSPQRLAAAQLAGDQAEYDRIRFNLTTSMIPRTMMQIDTLFNQVITMINNAVSPITAAGERDPNAPFDANNERTHLPVFVRNYANGTYVPRFVDDGSGTYVYVQPNPYDPTEANTLYRIGNVFINPALLRDGGPNLLALSLSANAQDDTTLVLDLMEQWKSENVVFFGMDHRPMSLDTAYRQMITDNSNATSQALGFVREQTTLVQAIDNRRQSVMSVSMDEELSFMLTFQHAYNANARMVNMLDSMMDTIINQMGR